jgi:hypothetical protein
MRSPTNRYCDGAICRYAFAFFLAVALFGITAEAASAEIKKVLSFYLDAEGRQSLSPSLYERDAYQAQLRQNPSQRSGLRFDVLWKGPRSGELLLRVELRGAKGTKPTSAVVEAPVRRRGLFARWSMVSLTGEKYGDFGELVAWRATLWQRDKLLAEQRSFLW